MYRVCVLVMNAGRPAIEKTRKAFAGLSEVGLAVGPIVVNRVFQGGGRWGGMAARQRREGVYLEEIKRLSGGEKLVYWPLLRRDVCGVGGG